MYKKPFQGSGNKISIDQRGFIKIDGVTIGKRIVHDGKTFLQVCDKDRERAETRGTRFPEISVEELFGALTNPEITQEPNSSPPCDSDTESQETQKKDKK